MGWYYTSDGERVNQKTINARMRKAKAIKKLMMVGEFCEQCGRNGVTLDMSHDISIQKAKNTGRTELCWDVNNLTIRCRKCHRKHDGL